MAGNEPTVTRPRPATSYGRYDFRPERGEDGGGGWHGLRPRATYGCLEQDHTESTTRFGFS